MWGKMGAIASRRQICGRERTWVNDSVGRQIADIADTDFGRIAIVR